MSIITSGYYSNYSTVILSNSLSWEYDDLRLCWKTSIDSIEIGDNELYIMSTYFKKMTLTPTNFKVYAGYYAIDEKYIYIGFYEDSLIGDSINPNDDPIELILFDKNNSSIEIPINDAAKTIQIKSITKSKNAVRYIIFDGKEYVTPMYVTYAGKIISSSILTDSITKVKIFANGPIKFSVVTSDGSSGGSGGGGDIGDYTVLAMEQ